MITLNYPYRRRRHNSAIIISLYQLLSLSFLSLTPSTAADPLSGLYKDSQQLLSFKASLPNSNSLHDWLPSNYPCNFSGVACKSSRVSAVDLAGAHLNVDFSVVASFLLSLPNLETLSLKSSNLTGSVSPAAKTQCSPVLSTIDLAENGLSGPVSDLSSLGSCSSLSSLNLSKNFFDFNLQSKDYSNGLRFKFRMLDLSYNKITGHNVVPWLLSGGCTDLRQLSLKGNKISGGVLVSDCKALEYLDLSLNNFSSAFPSLGDCSVLEYLDLSSNKFFGEVGASLSVCESLSFLNMTNNQLAGALPGFPADTVKSLYLSGNHFHGDIPEHFTGSLCSSVVELDLSFNNFSGTFPESLGACSALESLDISNNSFSGELPINTLLKMRSLKKVVLAFNNFFGGLPDSFSNMSSLEFLDLSSNGLTRSIPSAICQNPQNNLKVLNLQNNKFTGPIPDSLSNCSKLVSLDLSFNYLTGRIPGSLGSLSNLKDLMIWLNDLHGEIPPELVYMKSLENLILDFNELTGSIPTRLSNCTNLNWISLSNNYLTGEIPASFGQLANLAILKLGNNSISGSIPAELGNCQSLIWLDLNTNQLSGTIPPALFKQSGNIAVSLLTGKSFIYIKNDGSQQCHGAGNLLEFGGIRWEQSDRILARLPCNSSRVYKGITQPTFNHNGSMIWLDLSYNNLDGSIPKELGSMYYLSVLNLGHNNLSGPIPPELGNLKMIAIIDLSYNKLNGSIPQSLTGLGLSDIDLSNNALSGSIPQAAPFDTFPDYRFTNNSGLCGFPLPNCGARSNSGANQHQKSHRRQASLAGKCCWVITLLSGYMLMDHAQIL